MTRRKTFAKILLVLAGIAHLVERHLAKVEVASSSLVARSKKKRHTERCLPIRKHREAREKRYSFGYAVFLILAFQGSNALIVDVNFLGAVLTLWIAGSMDNDLFDKLM